jgi:hypothetical protein
MAPNVIKLTVDENRVCGVRFCSDLGFPFDAVCAMGRVIRFVDGPEMKKCVSCDRAANRGAHTRAKDAVLDLHRPGLCETRTLRWSRRDSNH